jgi:hypothetical protein
VCARACVRSIVVNALGPVVNVLEPMYEAMEDKTTQHAKDLKTMIDGAIQLCIKMWSRFHNFVLTYKAAPVLTAFLSEGEDATA